jgi:hypothetical protein
LSASSGEFAMNFIVLEIKSNFRSSVICFVWLTVFGLAVPGGTKAGDQFNKLINCDLHQGACSQTMTGVSVTLEVTPKPIEAMQDLSFKVTLTGKLPVLPKAPYIDLGMPGMQMGPNRVQLKPAGNDTYAGRGVIVRCPSGRRIWRATVIIPAVGQTDFIFDVVY